MAYKFQLGAAKLGGAITSSGVISGTSLAADAALVVAEGGTGATTLTDGGILLGSGTGAITAMAVLADGEMIVGDGTTDPVAESGATLRTSIGVAIGSDVQAYDADLDNLSGMQAGASAAVALLTSTEVAILDGCTATTAELNKLDGASAAVTAAKLSTLSALSDAEIGFLDDATAGTAVASKALVLDASKDATGIRNLTLAGNLTVNGTQTIMNVATMSVQDANIQIANNANKADGQGLTFGSGSAANKALFQLSNSAARLSSSLPLTAVQFIGAVVGNADSATVATTVTISDNESTDEENAIIFGAGGDVDGGNLGLESDGNLTYNPSSGRLSATLFSGSGASLTNVSATGVKFASAKLDSGVSATGSVGVSRYVIADSAAAAMLVNLPSIAPSDQGTMVIIKRVGGNNVTISSANTSQTVEGSNQDITLESNGSAVTLMATDEGDATHGGWRIV